MDYNVTSGNLERGLRVVDTVAIIRGYELTKQDYQQAAVLGWSVEFVRGQNYILIFMSHASNFSSKHTTRCLTIS